MARYGGAGWDTGASLRLGVDAAFGLNGSGVGKRRVVRFAGARRDRAKLDLRDCGLVVVEASEDAQPGPARAATQLVERSASAGPSAAAVDALLCRGRPGLPSASAPASSRERGPRPATERELRALEAMLEASLAAE